VNDVLRLKTDAALQEGDAHLRRLVGGTEKLAPVFLLSAEAMEALADETVLLLDQFIYRFTNYIKNSP
jgi:hypothetical protein